MLIESFLRYIRYEKNYSFHTVLSYKNDLFQFRDFVTAETGTFAPQRVDRDLVRNWVVALVEAGETARTVSRKVSALRSFFKYLVVRKEVSDTPVRDIQLPKIRKRLPSFVKQDEMDLLLDEVDFGDGFSAVRDRLIIAVFYSTGIRRAELIGLKDVDVDTGAATMKVTGKRNKQRIIPFGGELASLIDEYRTVRARTVGGGTADFFVRETGEPLYPQLVYRVVTRYLEAVCSLNKKSPHVLRHTFASAMLNNGAELNSVKELLGHSSLASTEVYTHITFEELKKSYKQAHPRAERKGGNYGN
ncbi:MAG: tyrosine recombinase XerC [Coprobacter sp.]|nr:tyrosine recombinase XerC [Coprobacter sp.]